MSQPTRATNSIGLIEAVRTTAHSLNGQPRDYDPLIDLIGDARIVLLGAASHGTHEFYRERARSPSGSSRKKASRRLRWKRIGLTLIASTATCAA
jgi:hypothetical protein